MRSVPSEQVSYFKLDWLIHSHLFSSVSLNTLKVAEPDKYAKFKELGLERVYFNKGL